LLKIERVASFVKQANHYLLAPNNRTNSNAQIDFLASHINCKLTILRNSMFVNFQIG